MSTWKILLLCILPCYRARDDGIFECGAHGRFEYCIDGIPGCVIGCHCHPGYYFDTESKICEPNTKLAQHYRRHYMPEPTRIQNPTLFTDVPQTESVPTLTTHNVIDEQVNDITKNADDLGDWLYNQFFKTIENQVINNTDKDSQLTRRSGRGSGPKHNKLKRRARKKGNRHKKRKKGLRGKLLRIAEDDSLFQSSESSESDSSDSDFSESYSSFESNSDEDHGHKKILLINKKPKPPLPSFIFLPNMNTPYYPPIGLPPPPIMPMYPMVPVPPMLPAPPLLNFPSHIPECEENSTTVTTEATTFTTTTVVTSTEMVITQSESPTTNAVEIEAPASEPQIQRSHYKRRRKKIKPLQNIPNEDEESQLDFYEGPRDSRQRLMKLLRQKLKNPRISDAPFKRHRKPFDKYSNQLVPPEALMNNDLTENIVSNNKNNSPVNFEDSSALENVDFKYLSQLIHRVNENQTQDMQDHIYNPQDDPKTINNHEGPKKTYHDFNVPISSGRRTNQIMNASKNDPADDSYYSNLGKQIATLIRTIDADKERQVNIEIEKERQNTEHPYFNENGPRNFWERFVRSPLKFFNSYKTRFDDIKNSNEILFKIENKVETVASTLSPLTLQELENMINIMEKARSQFQSKTIKIKNIKPSTKMLNVNLWPQEKKQFKKSSKSSTRPHAFNIKTRKAISNINTTRPEILNTKLNTHNANRDLYPFREGPNMYKLKGTGIAYMLQAQPAFINITKIHSQPMYKPQDRRTLLNSEKSRHTINPTILNYKNIKKYFFDVNNQYSFQNDNLRLPYSPASKTSQQQLNPLLPSPYFHHEINHVDYLL